MVDDTLLKAMVAALTLLQAAHLVGRWTKSREVDAATLADRVNERATQHANDVRRLEDEISGVRKRQHVLSDEMQVVKVKQAVLETRIEALE